MKRKLLDEKALIWYDILPKETTGWFRKRMRFGRKKREDKLYQQWARHSDLSHEAIPQKEASRDISLEAEKNKHRRRVLYILLGVGIALLCVGLVFIFT